MHPHSASPRRKQSCNRRKPKRSNRCPSLETSHLADPCQTTVVCQTALEPLSNLLFQQSKEPPMPKNKVDDLITDQEIAFARLVLSGTMTDREAAQSVGLNPETAAYTKSKPRVRAYMLEYRAAMQQQLLDQEADLSRLAVERQRRQELRREQVLDRLWEIAKMSPEMTRGSITGQVKALSMIVAIESLIPDRRAGASDNKSTPPPTQADIYPAACPPRPAVGLSRQQEKTTGPEPDPAPAQEQEEPGLAEPDPTPGSAEDTPPAPAMPPSPIPAGPIRDLGESASHTPAFFATPDTRAPFSIKRNPFARRR